MPLETSGLETNVKLDESKNPVEVSDPADSFEDALESVGLPRQVILKLLKSWEEESINV